MSETDLQRLIGKFSVHDEEIQEHATEIWAELRANCPVARSEAFGGFWMFSKYADVFDAERAPHLFSSFPVTVPPFGNPMPMIPIEMDPPVHSKYRRVVGHQFAQGAVSALEGQVRGIVENLFANIAGRREVDLVKELSRPLPIQVLLTLYMDIPAADQAYLAEQFVLMLTPDPNLPSDQVMAARQAAGMACAQYLGQKIAERRASPVGTDLITFLGRAEVDGAPLSMEEILGFLLLLIPAGFDTTASTLSRTFLHLAERPDLRKQLQADPTLIPSAVEEFLRITTAVTGQARTVTQDCTFAGHDFTQGDRLVLLWASANRDEDVFTDPDEIVLTREPNKHLAFGSGIHRCLGMHVAKMELRIMLEEFTRRIPDYHLDPDRPYHRHTGETWGLHTLPVIIDGVPG